MINDNQLISCYCTHKTAPLAYMTSIMFGRHMRIQLIIPIKWGPTEFTKRMTHESTSFTFSTINLRITCVYMLIQLRPCVQFLLTDKYLIDKATKSDIMLLTNLTRIHLTLTRNTKSVQVPEHNSFIIRQIFSVCIKSNSNNPKYEGLSCSSPNPNFRKKKIEHKFFSHQSHLLELTITTK